MSDGPQREMTRGEMLAAIYAANRERARCASERDAAIARAEKAEAERDGARGQNFVLDSDLKAALASLAREREHHDFTTRAKDKAMTDWSRAVVERDAALHRFGVEAMRHDMTTARAEKAEAEAKRVLEATKRFDAALDQQSRIITRMGDQLEPEVANRILFDEGTERGRLRSVAEHDAANARAARLRDALYKIRQLCGRCEIDDIARAALSADAATEGA